MQNHSFLLISFENVVVCYNFDSELKNTHFAAIQQIEISVRT